VVEVTAGGLVAVCRGLGAHGVFGVGGLEEGEPEARSATGGRLDLDTTPVAVGDLPDDGQSQA
jgi:hypothetical protein